MPRMTGPNEPFIYLSLHISWCFLQIWAIECAFFCRNRACITQHVGLVNSEYLVFCLTLESLIGFALCRALLRQVQQLPLAIQNRNSLKTQITTIIKRNAKLRSYRDISTAFRLGYEVRLQRSSSRARLLIDYRRPSDCYEARHDGRMLRCAF